MKMSNIFLGEVTARRMDEEALLELTKGENYGDDWHLEDDSYWLASNKEHAEAAAHAINCHDQLVEALDQAVTSMQDSGYSNYHLAVKCARKALAKARGEL